MVADHRPRPIDVLILSRNASHRHKLRLALSRQFDINIIGAMEPPETAAAAGETEGSTGLHPQVLVLDVSQRQRDSIAMLADWHTHLPQLKTLLVSDNFDDDFIGQALCYGARGFLSKTCPLEVYAKAIWVIQADDIWIGRRTLAQVVIRLIRKLQERSEAVAEHWVQEHQTADLRASSTQERDFITDREWEIIHLAAQSMTNKEIARHLKVSDKTVKTHLRHIFRKLNIKRRMQLLLLEDEFHRC